jgi:hypothetical protein
VIEGLAAAGATLGASPVIYAGINALHILAIAILLGAILPLDLGLLGLRAMAWTLPVARNLQRLAETGLAAAIITGGLLFAVKPAAYLANPSFVVKVALLGLALLNILASRLVHDRRLPGRATALASLLAWIGVLVAGRWIAFS